MAVDNLRYGRLTAAVDRWAVGDVELDRRVMNAEVVAQLVVQAFQYSFTFRHGHLDDLHVTGERVRLGGEAPNVEVVNADDAVHGLHCRADLVEVEGARCA